MLKITVEAQNPESPDKLETDFKINGRFFVSIMFEDDGKEHTPVTFDSVALEILYNDDSFIIGSDEMARPLAGEIAKSPAFDPFSQVPVQGGSFSDKNGPFTDASLLTLRPRTEDRIGPYRTTTGLAIYQLKAPFSLTPEMGKITVMAGVLYAAAGAISGTTRIVAVGHIFDGSRPVPYESVVGNVELLPLSDPQLGIRRYPDSFGN